jgi:hypothetical protein
MPVKFMALIASVVHYGLGNLSGDSRPPRPETVLDGARKFEEYLLGRESTPTPDIPVDRRTDAFLA